MKKLLKRLIIACLAASLMATGLSGISARAYDPKPSKVRIAKSSKKVSKGQVFEIKAKTTPYDAEDDYIRWEIVSGKKYVKFAERDRTGDEIELKAVKAGKAKVRCYVIGKNKKKYGDTITIKVKKTAAKYNFRRDGGPVEYEEVGEDFDLDVKADPAIKNKQLQWSIADTSIVNFVYGNKGREVELYAIKEGTTTVTCTCTNSKAKEKTVTYTVHVTPRNPYDR